MPKERLSNNKGKDVTKHTGVQGPSLYTRILEDLMEEEHLTLKEAATKFREEADPENQRNIDKAVAYLRSRKENRS